MSNMVLPISGEFHPEAVIGKPYHHGMLPYGGGFSLKTGKVLFATTREEHQRIIAELRTLE